MDFQLIRHLIGLRYRLLWAKTRTRSGKIALFMAGYLLFVLVAVFFAIVGAGGGMVAVRSGQAERIAQGILTALFTSATVTCVLLGFGMNEVFSDTELRRFPLKAVERRFARHFAGIVDPFWFLFLALYLGLALGLYLFGAGSLVLGVIAVLALFVCNYLAAQVVGRAMERIMQQKGGSLLLPLIIMVVCFLPSVAMPMLKKHAGAGKVVLRVLAFTPSFGAGTLMTRTGPAAFAGVWPIAWWGLGLTVALVILEKRPPRIRVAQTTRIRWDTPYARAAKIFGPRYAPLVEHWLLFLFRCKRFRIAYVMSLPLIPFLLFMWTKQAARADPFATAMGVFAIAGLAPAAAFLVNQFGYVGSGFRRYFLFPMDPAAALRASSVTLMALCSVYVGLAAFAWVLFAPGAWGARGIVMLLASGVFGLCFFHGVGLWTTLYGARRADPNKTMGNDLSLVGNVVVVGGMMAMLIGPMTVGQFHKGLIAPDRWLVAVGLAALAACFYLFSLRSAPAILSSRREALLAVLERKA
jgi:hypothetical protein